jgi:hypothetical protein
MLAAALVGLSAFACNGGAGPGPDADAGGQAEVDAGQPDPAADAGSPAADAGRLCPAAHSACGANCCDDAIETCSGGGCVERGCATSETACGKACCNRATEYCDAANTCQPSATCNTREVACGQACCDTRTSFCALAASSTCDTLATCINKQIVCGARCCDALTQTCDAAVHACRGAQPTACDPLAPTECVAAESCQVAETGWTCSAAGTGLEGDACSSANLCGPGLDCLGSLFDAFCYRYCLVGDDLTCRGGFCVEAFEDRRVGICLCDPVTQRGCTGDDACYFNGVSAACGPAGPGLVGAACQGDRDCAKGLSCGFAGTCAGFCDPFIPGDCSAGRGGTTCFDYGDGSGFCGTRCDALKQNCPDPNDACFASPLSGAFCARPGATPDGARCDSPTACARGSNCMRLSPESDYRCLPACNANAVSCGKGGLCVDLNGEGVGGCVSALCDPVAQTGCGPGQACYWDEASLAYACLAAGSGPAGAACALDPDCFPGLTCVGECVPYCRPQASPTPCTGEGAACRDDLGSGFGACVNDRCDPRAQDCANAADACYPAQTGTFCAAPGTVADGLTCTAVTDCRKGSTCLGSSQSKQCYRLCDATAATDLCAATSQTCITMSGPLGVCY